MPFLFSCAFRIRNVRLWHLTRVQYNTAVTTRLGRHQTGMCGEGGMGRGMEGSRKILPQSFKRGNTDPPRTDYPCLAPLLLTILLTASWTPSFSRRPTSPKTRHNKAKSGVGEGGGHRGTERSSAKWPFRLNLCPCACMKECVCVCQAHSRTVQRG